MKKTLLVILLATLVTLPSFAREVSDEQKISGLYAAFFNRAPDMDGLNAWKTMVEDVRADGKEPIEVLKYIAFYFSGHPVFASTYGNLNNEQFVRAVYINALGREGDSEGVVAWTELLDDGMSRSDMIAIFINTSLTVDLIPSNFPTLSQAELDAGILRQNLITYKTEVSVAFVNELDYRTNITNLADIENDPAYKASIKVLSGVNEDRASVDDAIACFVAAGYSADIIDWINTYWDVFVETTFATATTQNAFKAYDAMSIATYLPSLFTRIYNEITDGGSGGHWTCGENGGSFDVTFIDIPESVVFYRDTSNTSILAYPGSYEFNDCLLNIDGKDVFLDGTILSYSLPKTLETTIIETEITGYIKSGFKFEIDNDIAIEYKAFPLVDVPVIMEYFDDDGKGSFFQVTNYDNGFKTINNAVFFNEETIGDIMYSGSFVNTLSFTGSFTDGLFDEEETGDIVIEKGIFATDYRDEMSNLFLVNAYDDLSYYAELLIYINSREYFRGEDSDDQNFLKTILVGKNNKNVTVWQDNDEVVHAQTEDTFDSSSVVHTPSFN